MISKSPTRGDLLLEIMVFCRIQPLKRPRKAGNANHFYQPKDNQLQLFEELLPYSALVKEPLDGPMIMDMHCIFLRHENDQYPTAKRYGDDDNLRKAVNDALVHSKLVSDDRFIIGGETWKLYGEEDQAQIRLWRPK